MSTDCCTNILNIGCVYHCDTVVTGVTAAIAGIYRISLVPGGGFIDRNYGIGDAIDFPASFLNEDKVTIFKVLDPNNNVVQSGDNECYRVDIKAGVDLTDVNT